VSRQIRTARTATAAASYGETVGLDRRASRRGSRYVLAWLAAAIVQFLTTR